MTRYYDPETATFITMDSTEYLKPEAVGGVDLYAYCQYNPVMYIDPTGHVIWWIVALIIIGVVAVAAGTWKAVDSANKGSNAGEIALDFFKGLFMGMVAAGAGLLLLGVGGVLLTGITAIGTAWVTFAALGTVAMIVGSTGVAAFSGEEALEFESFPQPGTIPVFPPSITGF